MSEQKKPLLTLTAIAAGAIAACRFVTFGGAQGGENAVALGVAATKADAAGDAVPVDVLGTTTVEAGAAFAVGADLACDANGKAQATNGTTLTVVNARALEAAAADGDLVHVLLTRA